MESWLKEYLEPHSFQILAIQTTNSKLAIKAYQEIKRIYTQDLNAIPISIDPKRGILQKQFVFIEAEYENRLEFGAFLERRQITSGKLQIDSRFWELTIIQEKLINTYLTDKLKNNGNIKYFKSQTGLDQNSPFNLGTRLERLVKQSK